MTDVTNLPGTQIIRDATSDSHTIIYILVTDEECRRPNSLVVQLCLRLHLLKRGLIPHLVPLSMVSRQAVTLDPSTSSHRTIFSRLAFTVYDRLPVLLQRHVTKRLLQLTVEGSNPTSALQATRVCPAPAFRLVPHTKSSINFTLQWPASSLDILDRHRLFHIAYSISADGRWLFLAAIDERAEYHTLRVRFVEGLEPKLVLKRVWNYAKEVTEPVNVEWRISIAKAGVMPVAEVQSKSSGCGASYCRPTSVLCIPTMLISYGPPPASIPSLERSPAELRSEPCSCCGCHRQQHRPA